MPSCHLLVFISQLDSPFAEKGIKYVIFHESSLHLIEHCDMIFWSSTRSNVISQKLEFKEEY